MSVKDLIGAEERLHYWTDDYGNPQRQGLYKIKTKELPAPLRRAYTELMPNNSSYMDTYLVDFEERYWIALETEYDTDCAVQLKMSHAELIADARHRAAKLAEALPEYQVLFGYNTVVRDGCNYSSQLAVLLPPYVSVEEYNRVGSVADKIVFDEE